MSGLVDEWVEKADEDYRAARLALEAPDPIPSVAAFHSQQCVEKYLKAYLTQHRLEFRPRHPLRPLLEMIQAFDADIAEFADDLDLISDYAVDVRYPGRSATQDEAEESLTAATRVRTYIRGKLGVGPTDD